MNKSIIGAVVGATVLAGGCGAVTSEAERLTVRSSPTLGTPTAVPTDSPADSPTGTPTGTETGEGTGSPAPGDAQASLEGLKQAGQAAIAAVPGSKVISMESEENGRRWEVQVVGEDGTEHQLDVEGGKVVNGPTTEEDDADDKAKHRERLTAAKLDYAQAADKIVAAVPEGRITELNLDDEQDKTVWESDVITANGTKQEVAIDAATGEVTRKSGSTS
ncbi:PepSY domain-containing protein [Nonomuraea sp. NPDC049504]|uniref:PepSY domain-containing protein n=1 Tax=Nonomuraea sp. NPDC049504 TaxID=3154729 RepID=UPI003448BA5E